MENVVSQLMTSAINWAVPAMAGLIVGYMGTKSKQEKRRRCQAAETEEAIKNAVILLLRNEIVRMHEFYVVDGNPIDLLAREKVQKVHDTYVALGGNDVGTQLFEEVVAQKMSG